MKKITVVRHAEAGQGSSDFERRLTDYGLMQAKSTASQLSSLISPQLLIASPANRTRETADFLIDEFHVDSESCKYDERVYEASTEDLRSIIGILPENLSDVVLIGHNPSVSSLVSSWADSYAGFSTACAIVLEIEADSWGECVYKPAKIVSKVLPRM